MEEHSGSLELEICPIEKRAVRAIVSEVVIPGEEGFFTVYPGHTPFLSSLHNGPMVARDAEGELHFYAINGGFAEVLNDKVLVLARSAESDEEIDQDRAEQARQRAERRLQGGDTDVDVGRAEAALERALVRLQVKRRAMV